MVEVISKKELLTLTGISYGQLYRWKRERLIPEEWFMKQSSYTGQETFFPKDQILSRIKSILELKDIYSLEELAKILSPEVAAQGISITRLSDVFEIDRDLLEVLPKIYGREEFDFFDCVFLIALSQGRKLLKLTKEETIKILSRNKDALNKLNNINTVCIFIYVEDSYHTVFVPVSAALVFDDSIEVKAKINFSKIGDQVKTKYTNLFQ